MGSQRASAIDVVRAAYRFDVGHAAWLQGVLDAARPFVDLGFGAWSFFFDGPAFRRGELAYQHPSAVGLPPDWVDHFRRTATIASRDQQILYELTFGRPCQSMSEILRHHPRAMAQATAAIGIPGVVDSLGVSARDATGSGVFIGAHAGRRLSLDARTRARLQRLAAHLATALRLRRQLGPEGIASAPALLERAEAVIGARVRVEHAVGAATATARPTRASDPDAALAAWEALVAGRWSIVASFDDGGRRLLLAQPNPPASAVPSTALTAREQQVASYLVLGHAQKLIGYELGIATGTVSALVGRIKRKLGVTSIAGLLAALRALQGETS